MITTEELLGLIPHLPQAEERAAKLARLGETFLALGSARGVTALRDRDDLKREFLIDSLAAYDSLPKGEGARVIDIGTGGGIPGLVLAIVRPDLKFCLTDSTVRKTDWVRERAGELSLANVEVVASRLEILGHQAEFRGTFDAVTAKALAPLRVLIEFALPLLRIEGRLIAYKGPGVIEEIGEAQKALAELSGKVYRCLGYRLDQKDYRIVEVQKTAATTDRYPRRDGVPQKKPL